MSADDDLRQLPEEGLFGPGAVTWRVHADPSMAVSGVRALLLQALHPLAMAGVAQHSAFREDPWGGLYRTAFFIGAVTYGTGPEAADAVARVRKVHARVVGTDPFTGRGYRADDPELLTWVHCTEVGSFLEVARRAGLKLSARDADTYLVEQARIARLVGVPETWPLPESTRRLREYFDEVRPDLALTPAAKEAARFALLPPFPGWVRYATPARPAWAALAALGFALLPPWARRLYGAPGWRATDRVATAEVRALRSGLILLPSRVREGPHLKAARIRWAAETAGDPRTAARRPER